MSVRPTHELIQRLQSCLDEGRWLRALEVTEQILHGDQEPPPALQPLLLRLARESGLIDPTFRILEGLRRKFNSSQHLFNAELQLAQLSRDLPRVSALTNNLLQDPALNPTRLPQLRRLRFDALLNLDHPAADAALAALPCGDPEDQRARLLGALQLARQRFRFQVAIALAETLDQLHPPSEALADCRRGLEIALQLALLEGDQRKAHQLLERWRIRLAASPRESDRLMAHAEPVREWRLELSTSPRAVALLGTLRSSEPSQLPRAIAEALVEEEQASVLTFALPIALHHAGLSGLHAPSQAPPGPCPPAIPPHLWLLRRDPDATAGLVALEARWRECHPTWRIRWVDHQPPASWPLLNSLPPLVREALGCILDPLIRADLLMLALVWLRGGMAVCWGARPQRSLAEVVDGGVELFLVQDDFGSLSLEMIGGVPGHPFLQDALQSACEAVVKGQGYGRWSLTGACLLNAVFARFARKAVAGGGAPAGVRVIRRAELRRWIGLNLPLPRPRGVPAEATPEGCLDRRRCLAAMGRLVAQTPAASAGASPG